MRLPALGDLLDDPSGGARRDRTDDLMLAKHALSQLSYGPVPEDECLPCAPSPKATAQQPSCEGLAGPKRSARRLVGLGRLELPTSRLSSARSNQLSYKPLTTKGRSLTPSPKVSRPKAWPRRRPRRVFVREERETKTAASRQWSSRDLAIRGP